jgi:hypothetical protein
MERAALGFSPHTGWAAVVALAGARGAPEVVARRRVEVATTFETGAVYHAGQGLPLDRAEALVRSSEESFVAAAQAQLEALAGELRGRGLEPAAGAIVAGGGRPLPALEVILRAHPLVHAAEAELYRRVFLRASEACGIPTARVLLAELPGRVASATGLPARRVDAVLAELGKAAGRPWARDQKLAALAAWGALALGRAPAGGRRRRRRR